MNSDQAQNILYEYPLNERVRNYLRIEHLLTLMQPVTPITPANYARYFNALFAILDLCERSDIRTDLLKDLDKRCQQLQHWAQHPEVDSPALEATRNQLALSLKALQGTSRIGSELKQDRLLSSIRQRFSMPGGTCNFDVPHFHYWLSQGEPVRQRDTARWWSELAEVSNGLALELHLMREQGEFQPVNAPQGLLQENADAMSLLRIQVPAEVPAYPVVSGHKQRFSIRFMKAHPEQGRPSYEDDVVFQLARCP